jgi:hypothetical protein
MARPKRSFSVECSAKTARIASSCAPSDACLALGPAPWRAAHA